MFGSPKDVHADVTIESVNPLEFSVTPSKEPSKPPVTMQDGELVFRNDNRPGFKVRFHLKSPTHGYLFPRNAMAKEAVWSQFGEKVCPKSAVWDVFTNPKISADGKTLTVHNRNGKGDVGAFGYTLRVTDDGGKSYLPLDPGGMNTNGPTGPGRAMTYAAIGVVTLAVAAFAAFEFELFSR